MKRLRPAQLPGLNPYDALPLTCAKNSVDNTTPTFVNAGSLNAGQFDNGSVIETQNGFALFAQTFFEPVIVLGNMGASIWPLILDTSDSFAPPPYALPTFMTVYAMETSWDPTTLTWNNQPSPAGDAPSVTMRLAYASEVARGGYVILDCTKTKKTIVGLKIICSSGGASNAEVFLNNYIGFPLLSSATINYLFTGQTRKQFAIATRASTSTQRTLTTTLAHGLSTGAYIQVSGLPSQYLSQDDLGNQFWTLVTVIDSFTLQYTVAQLTSYSEASTAAPGAAVLTPP